MRNRTAAIERQRAQLLTSQEDNRSARNRHRRLMEWLIERRPVDPHCRCGHQGCELVSTLPPIDLLDWRGDGEVLPVVAGELFVEVHETMKHDFTKMSSTLEALGWSVRDDPANKQQAIPGTQSETESVTVVRLEAADRDTKNLKQALGILNEGGWTAGPNHIMPLAWTIKGKAGPEIDCEPLGKLKGSEESGSLIIAVDTGLAGMEDLGRTDGRLARAHGDRDLLDEVDRNGNPQPDGCLDLGAGHGTSVAGVIESVDPTLDIKILKALGPDGVGDEATIARTILAAAEQLGNCGVINLSFGSQSYNDQPPMLLSTELAKLGLTESQSQLCVVAAAGNWGDDRPSWPAAMPGVISVGGLNEDGGPAEWSSRGEDVAFSAQAEGIVVPYVVGKETPGTSDPGDPYDEYPDRWDGPNPNALWLGTSFAAPQVAAKLAHYLSKHQGASRADAVEWLEGHGEPLEDFGVRLPDLWRQRH